MKKIFLLAAICTSAATAWSQSFQQGIGLGVYVENMDNVNRLVGSSISYHPRMSFIENENMAVSVGVPLTFGYAENYSSYYFRDDIFGNESTFMMDAPVMINYNMSGGASKISKQHVGGFFGLGYGYHYSSKRKYAVDDHNGGYAVAETGGNSFGTSVNGGIRFAVGPTHSQSVEIKVSYYASSGSRHINTAIMGAAFNF